MECRHCELQEVFNSNNDLAKVSITFTSVFCPVKRCSLMGKQGRTTGGCVNVSKGGRQTHV